MAQGFQHQVIPVPGIPKDASEATQGVILLWVISRFSKGLKRTNWARSRRSDTAVEAQTAKRGMVHGTGGTGRSAATY